jgi:hypothetical protein
VRSPVVPIMTGQVSIELHYKTEFVNQFGLTRLGRGDQCPAVAEHRPSPAAVRTSYGTPLDARPSPGGLANPEIEQRNPKSSMADQAR